MSNVWLITGSSRGLGRALAEAVLAAGHHVVATARTPEQLAHLVAAYGPQVHPIALDVTDAAAARGAVQSAIDAFGRLDVVVNNAGYANVNSIEDVDEQDFRQQVETNFFGVVHVTRAALPVLRRQRSGHIIQISSIGGRLGTPGLSAYQSSKWAVEGFSEVLAKEVAPFGIHVTIVEPGGFRTDWAGRSMTRVERTIGDYDELFNPLRENRLGYSGRQLGDPARAGAALLTALDSATPPGHLVLGSDAVRLVRAARAEVDSEIGTWEKLSVSTDFPGEPVTG
jgi:NAD(P)-dependent dehydrogenase (short-subunit alcohol dehydrogenase family)